MGSGRNVLFNMCKEGGPVARPLVFSNMTRGLGFIIRRSMPHARQDRLCFAWDTQRGGRTIAHRPLPARA